MFTVKARRSLAAIPVILTVVALAACAAPAADKKDDAANDAAAARFVTCLTGEGQTAKIIEGGQVGMLMPDAPEDSPLGTVDGGSMAFGEGDGEDKGMTMISTDDDGTWMASTTANGYPEEGGQREAWATCEEKVPEFAQPEPDMSGAEATEALKFDAEAMIKASLAFAGCARENGFADFADPDADGMLQLPAGITEDEARALLTACEDELGEMPPFIDQKSIESLDFDWFAVIGEFFEGGFMQATVIPEGEK
ncbi:hypothetical protein [Microbacterium sp. LWO13-1.2]|uniref:hypothetical protein n=1 Tax=Microbacterium sp. LWO13-1.2 TaxID=3135262 RepID=UPI003138DD93